MQNNQPPMNPMGPPMGPPQGGKKGPGLAAMTVKNKIQQRKNNYKMKMQKAKTSAAKALIPFSFISGVALGSFLGFKFAKRHYGILPGTVVPKKGIMGYLQRRKAAKAAKASNAANMMGQNQVVQQQQPPVIVQQQPPIVQQQPRVQRVVQRTAPIVQQQTPIIQTVSDASVEIPQQQRVDTTVRRAGERLVAAQRLPVEKVREYDVITRKRVPYHEVREVYEGPASVEVDELPAKEYVVNQGTRVQEVTTTTTNPQAKHPMVNKMRQSVANLL